MDLQLCETIANIRRNYPFNTFLSDIRNCFTQLEIHNRPLAEPMKIGYLRNAIIREPRHGARWEVDLLQPPYINDFEAAAAQLVATAYAAGGQPATLLNNQTNIFVVLFFHQVLHIPDLQKHLLCPNQLRHNQVLVNETPLLYIPPDERDNSHHSIIFQANNPIQFYTFHSLLMALPPTLIPGFLPGKKSTTLMSVLIYM